MTESSCCLQELNKQLKSAQTEIASLEEEGNRLGYEPRYYQCIKEPAAAEGAADQNVEQLSYWDLPTGEVMIIQFFSCLYVCIYCGILCVLCLCMAFGVDMWCLCVLG